MPDSDRHTPTPSLPGAAVEIAGLTKRYQGRYGQPDKLALNDVTLSVPRGSFFGLLGPNGAGKSTMINILAGLVVKSSGTAKVWGFDCTDEPRQARSAIGVVPQELNLDPFFTPSQLLDLQAGLYGVPRDARRTREILEAVGLADKADAYARTLSGGMRRRLLVAKAMVHSPPVLVLDEPTAGVDIQLRQQLWAYVERLNRQGTTILLTTHYLEEAERLCDRIAIIDKGRVVADDDKSALLRRLDSKTLTLTLDQDPAALLSPLARFNPVVGEGGRLTLHYRPSHTRVAEILDAVSGAGFGIVDLATHDSDLEDIFLRLTGQGETAGVS